MLLGDHESDRPGAFLREAADFIEVLSLFGLEGGSGGWVVPATLQEFARAALQSANARRCTGAF
jgi:hypothetical protein